MTTLTSKEPTYIFRITPELALRWTSLSILLFFVTLAGVSRLYQVIHGQPWSFSWQTSSQSWAGVLTFLAFVVIFVGTLVIHELIHGLAFRAFGGSPRYGIKVKYFFPYAYATSPGDIFSRNAFVTIGLAPLVVIDLVCLVLLAVFPQATWLVWVLVINTSGASGDIWMATLLLRCPKSIQVEDRRAGMAIYTPPALDPRSLPFKTSFDKTRSVLGVWGNTTLIVLMVFLVGSFLLPLIFNILQVPSFVLGTDAFWLIRWQNDATGFGLTFNLVSLLLIAAGIGILGVLVQVFSRSKSTN
ncbi:DUF3267 domain-containing protein [Chlorogloeopsis fritschii PCC 9212]|uniref:DUF3267 domain-containing protein n=1 Tax=Chlorogloeopsis fritschii PCC 6912 TaxID=211165 RepID=A0A3S0XHT6_CHLFR|nr:DUF3267 domain-containing protein [Chlorogloeopsis fritschii]RUR73240.1 hypothetical protein PCC6912_57650 [Chlorogloeopsis fritschii PCC 6912]